ncbi:MAG: apolipoprotein N-acyltransferase [Planctomycetota bacterium]
MAVLVAVPLVFSFLPGWPAHGYGHLLLGLPVLMFFRHPAHRRRLLLYAAGIGLQVLAYPDPDWGFLGWVLLWPYLLARRCDDGASWWRSAVLFGFLRAYAGFYWLGNVHFTGWIAVSVLAALVFAFVFELTLRRLTVFPFALRVATGWLLFEGVHAWIFKGFPWLFLSHTQYRFLLVIQAADVVGAFGISFLMAYVQAAALDAWLKRRAGLETAGAAAALVLVLLYGVMRAGPEGQPGPGVLMVQTAFPHSVKVQDKKTGGREMLRRLEMLTREGLAEHPETALIVWPETMHPVPYIVEGDRHRFWWYARKAAREFRRPIVYGINSYDSQERWDRGRGYNSVVLADRAGALRGLYKKQRLVPMGEEFVARWFFAEETGDRWFRFLSTHLGLPRSCDLEAGEGFVTLDAGPRLGCAPLICFEGLYADLVRGAVAQRRVDLVLHLVNNGWFGRSYEQRQCVASWVFRAVEARTPFLSCANAGITCAVAPSGEILGRVDRVMEEGWLLTEVPPRWPPPIFLLGGVWALPAGLLLGLGVGLLLSRRPRGGPGARKGRSRRPV